VTDTLGRRLIRAFGTNDQPALDEIYAEDAVLHTPLARVDGRAAIKDAVAELHRGFPGLRAALHDEFTSADGTRACLRQRLDWSNTGAFQGRAPTGRSGTATETHSFRLRDGQIAEQIAGVSTFGLPQLLLVDLGLGFPRHLPDPEPEIEATGASLAHRFVSAFTRRDLDAFDDLLLPDATVYTPLGWPVAGRDAVKAFVDEFHASNPGLRGAPHDAFENADGTRACWRIRLHFHNTEPFFGNPPTGEAGVMPETHSVTVRDGRVARLVVGDNGFVMPHQELVTWRMDFPADEPDPDPELAAASPPG
jgi:ketosteroid isomerase-like protein